MNEPSENPDMEKETKVMNYSVIALIDRKPALHVMPVCGVNGRLVRVELTDEEAFVMATNLMQSIQLNRKEE